MEFEIGTSSQNVDFCNPKRKQRTDAKCTDKNAKDVGIACFLNSHVAAHQKFVGAYGFEAHLTGRRIVAVHLTYSSN